MYGLRLGVLVVYRKCQFEAWLSRSLPEVLSVVTGLCVVKFTETSEAEELFARWRCIFFIDWGKEALDLGALVSYYKAAETELEYVLVRHVEFVDKLAAMWSKLLTTVL